MGIRQWFRADNTSGLTAEDLIILNRAARYLFRFDRQPRQSDLMALRMTYKPGMSAADLFEKVEGALP